MRIEELDRARWRTDLDLFAGQFTRVRTLYGTRRAALVGRTDLPVFDVSLLDREFVSEALGEIGVEFNDFSEEFRGALLTPFMLSIGRRFLARRADIRSAPTLLTAFISEITETAEDRPGKDLRDRLATLASSLVELGRETVLLRTLCDAFLETPVGAHRGDVS